MQSTPRYGVRHVVAVVTAGLMALAHTPMQALAGAKPSVRASGPTYTVARGTRGASRVPVTTVGRWRMRASAPLSVNLAEPVESARVVGAGSGVHVKQTNGRVTVLMGGLDVAHDVEVHDGQVFARPYVPGLSHAYHEAEGEAQLPKWTLFVETPAGTVPSLEKHVTWGRPVAMPTVVPSPFVSTRTGVDDDGNVVPERNEPPVEVYEASGESYRHETSDEAVRLTLAGSDGRVDNWRLDVYPTRYSARRGVVTPAESIAIDVMIGAGAPTLSLPSFRQMSEPVCGENPAKDFQAVVRVRNRGLKRLTRLALTNAGVDLTGLGAEKIEIWRNGTTQVPFVVDDPNGGFTDDGDAVVFYATQPGDREEFAYFVRASGTTQGVVATQTAAPGAGASLLEMTEEAHFPGWQLYFQQLGGAESADHFGYSAQATYVLVPNATDPTNPALFTTRQFPRDYAVTLNDVDTSGRTAELDIDVGVQLFAGNYSRAIFFMNAPALPNPLPQPPPSRGTPIGTVDFFQPLINVDVPFSSTLLVEGTNRVGLSTQDPQTVASDYGLTTRALSSNIVNSGFALRYPVLGTVLTTTPLRVVKMSGAGEAARLTMQNAARVAVLDVTNAASPAQQLTLVSGNEVRFAAQTGRTYAAGSLDAAEALTPVATRNEVNLRCMGEGAEYIVIGPEAWQGELDDLVAHRETTGLSAMSVTTERIAQQFGGGVLTAGAVTAFLQHTYENVTPRLRYVTFLGTYNFDPMERITAFVNANHPAIVPPYFFWTEELGEVVGDHPYTTFNSKNLATPPKFAIGRIAARTQLQAQTYIDRLIAYETREPTESRDKRYLGINDCEQRFFDLRQEGASYVPSDYTIGSVNGLTISNCNIAQVRTSITNEINAGSLLTNYMGHGASTVWGKQILRVTEATTIAATAPGFVMIAITCSNGAYQFQFEQGMSDAMMFGAAGPIAMINTAGFHGAESKGPFNDAMLLALFERDEQRVGDMMVAGWKQRLAVADAQNLDSILRTYFVLGDSATLVNTPFPARPQLVTAAFTEETLTVDVSWSASISKDVARYELWRAPSDALGNATDSYTLLTEPAFAGLSYADTSITATETAQFFVYKVKTVDDDGNESNFSDAALATVKLGPVDACTEIADGCSEDESCPPDRFCRRESPVDECGVCTPLCAKDQDCESGNICNLLTGICYEPECFVNEDCTTEFFVCVDNVCIDGRVACDDELDCFDTQDCVDGYCKNIEETTGDDDDDATATDDDDDATATDDDDDDATNTGIADDDDDDATATDDDDDATATDDDDDATATDDDDDASGDDDDAGDDDDDATATDDDDDDAAGTTGDTTGTDAGDTEGCNASAQGGADGAGGASSGALTLLMMMGLALTRRRGRLP